jgi:hypothetical protein
MRIVQYPNRYNNHWVVFADWYGKERVVHSGPNIYAVCLWAALYERKQNVKV